MSTKLNAEELAAKRYPGNPTSTVKTIIAADKAEGYSLAIREVAQPLADQRDELLEALDVAMKSLATYGPHPIIEMQARSAIAKCTPKE